MASQVTVTAKTGPAQQVTAQVLGDVQRMDFDLRANVLFVHQSPSSERQIKEFDLNSVATVTFTVSGRNYTMVVSE